VPRAVDRPLTIASTRGADCTAGGGGSSLQCPA